MPHIVSVLVPTPKQSHLPDALSYWAEEDLAPGTLVKVPLGTRVVLGIVWREASSGLERAAVKRKIELKSIAGLVEGFPALSPGWLDLVAFCAQYYQRAVGEVALWGMPPQLKNLSSEQIHLRLSRWQRNANKSSLTGPKKTTQKGSVPAQDTHKTRDDLDDIAPQRAVSPPPLSPEQSQALSDIESHAGPFLLFGSTGSGKTEVYLRAIQALFERDPSAQALIMVPEINLTPQLEARVKERFEPLWGEHSIVCLHSGLTPAQRLGSWLAAHFGKAKVVLGTRMSIFASIPRLKIIIVDEEHDVSYKQQEGARYSARDLAVYRGRVESARVILGSATPSLESWHHSQQSPTSGNKPRYQLVAMPARIGNASLPQVHRVDMNHQPRHTVFSAPLLAAIESRLKDSEQVLIVLNRRGYAPVLQCNSCGWKTRCHQCSAFKVFHKLDRTLRCHHCGQTERVPKACPVCADQDIGMLGVGTQQLEEQLQAALQALGLELGREIQIERIDADSTQAKGSLETRLQRMHAGDVDVLIGTQMIAKGHDFRRVTLVAAIDVDSALFSNDFRACERLFALLMQAAGRAGRDAHLGQERASEMWLQTHHPKHALFEALKAHDYVKFATEQLKDRELANMPPFSSQALIRVEARTAHAALGFLNELHTKGSAVLTQDRAIKAQSSAAMFDTEGVLTPSAPLAGEDTAPAELTFEDIVLYSAVPMQMQKLANVERYQLLIECASRVHLQRFLKRLHEPLHSLKKKHRGVLRWVIDVDPQSL